MNCKNEALKIYSPFLFPYSGITEIGKRDLKSPCVELGAWSGSGYARDMFVVWNCDDMEEALDRWAAYAVKNGLTGLYMDELSEDDDEETTDWINIGWSVSVWVYGPELAITEYKSGADYLAYLEETKKASRAA